LIFAFIVLALNIVPHNVLLALGQVQFVSSVNIVGGVVSLLVAAALIPSIGLVGAAIGRLLYGPITILSLWRVQVEFQRAAGIHGRAVSVPTY
jgi:O-antigen/teichoic acid export membrane protein